MVLELEGMTFWLWNNDVLLPECLSELDPRLVLLNILRKMPKTFAMFDVTCLRYRRIFISWHHCKVFRWFVYCIAYEPQAQLELNSQNLYFWLEFGQTNDTSTQYKREFGNHAMGLACRHNCPGRFRAMSASLRSFLGQWPSSRQQSTTERSLYSTLWLAGMPILLLLLLLYLRGQAPVGGVVELWLKPLQNPPYGKWWSYTQSRTTWTSSQRLGAESRVYR